MKVVANPVRLSATPPAYNSAPPLLGQHTAEVLGSVLGMGEAGSWSDCVKAVSAWFPRKYRGRATGFWSFGVSFGLVVSVPIVTWINVTLFDRASRQLRVRSLRALSVEDPLVVEAADFFGLRTVG